jgi:cyclic AMP-dependent transcription factor ATF-4
LEEAEVIEVIEKPAPAPKKTERRGRKPVKKDGLNYVKDKALRKKEQNKTAATRYRQKKKQELAVTLAEEEELQTVHDDLEKEKEKVGSELRMIRSLLRDMLQARKKRPSATPTPASARLTASSIVQAQRIANRRK